LILGGCADTIFGIGLLAYGTERFSGTKKEKRPGMKKYFLVLLVIAVILTGIASQAFADDNAFTKFGRGMSNILISPAEIYAQPVLLSQTNEIPVAFFGGLIKGISMFVVREVVGVYDVITFPIPFPKGYKPVFNPATTFTDWNTRYTAN
jgi:putative exosortase-associated protein (TIGR04073 family)